MMHPKYPVSSIKVMKTTWLLDWSCYFGTCWHAKHSRIRLQVLASIFVYFSTLCFKSNYKKRSNKPSKGQHDKVPIKQLGSTFKTWWLPPFIWTKVFIRQSCHQNCSGWPLGSTLTKRSLGTFEWRNTRFFLGVKGLRCFFFRDVFWGVYLKGLLIIVLEHTVLLVLEVFGFCSPHHFLFTRIWGWMVCLYLIVSSS